MGGSEEKPNGADFARESKPDPDTDAAEALRRLRVAERKLRKYRTGTEIILEAVRQAVDDFPAIQVPPKPERQRKKREEIAVVHLSDTQIGKVTESYDSTVAEQRVLQMARKTCAIADIRRNSASIRECRVYLGGDMVEGEDVFPTQAFHIDSSVYDQAVVTTPGILARFLLVLLESFERVHVVAVVGNHGRNGPRGVRASEKTNWDLVAYASLQRAFFGLPECPRKDFDGRLSMHIAEDTFYAVDAVWGWGNLIVHGDQITGGFAGFPWYGTAKKAWGWIDAIPQPWDYLWFGHFHTYASAVLNYRTFLANGTTESDNDYALANLAAAGHPCQRLAFFDEEWGLIADHQVFLGDERLPASARGK